MFKLTQETGWLAAPAQHEKSLLGWICEDTAGSCHKPRGSEAPFAPVGRDLSHRQQPKGPKGQPENIIILTFSKNMVSVLVLCLLISDMPCSFPMILGFFCKSVKNIIKYVTLSLLFNIYDCEAACIQLGVHLDRWCGSQSCGSPDWQTVLAQPLFVVQ